MNDETFAARLNQLMEARSLTIREVSEAVKISHSTLQNWRSGTAPTDFGAIKQLANLLGVSFSFLLTGEDDSRPSNDLSVEEVFMSGGEIFEGYLEVSVKRLIPRNKKKKN